MSAENPGRRNFLTRTGLLAGAGWLTVHMPALLAAGEAADAQRSTGETWKNISKREASILADIVDQIIPPDDTPGASQAGVVYFIDNVLGGFMSELAEPLKEGVAELERDGFSALPFDQQTTRLEQIENTAFFNTLISMTHMGMFAMPSWGGNRDLAGWKMLGFKNLHSWQPPFGYYDAQAMTTDTEIEHG